jgi:hypothetical protein
MKRLGLFRIDKAIEIIGLDIAEMGGVGEEIYEKMRRDFGSSIASPRSMTRVKENINSNTYLGDTSQKLITEDL